MNPNKTKDFDLRQEDSVIYQRSRAGTTLDNAPENVQDPHIPADHAGQSLGPGSNGGPDLAASLSAGAERSTC